MPAGGAIVTGALALGKAAYGFFDEKKAKREEDALKTPFYKVQDEYLQNRDIAAQQAESGIGASSLNYLTKETGRGLSGGISGTLQAGGDPNQIASLLDKYTQSVGKLAVEDTALKTQKINQFIEKNADVAGQKTAQFAINELQPYQAKLKQLQQRRGADVQNTFGGLSEASGALSAYGTAVQNKDLLKSTQSTGSGQLFSASYPKAEEVTAYSNIFNITDNTGPQNFPAPHSSSLSLPLILAEDRVPSARAGEIQNGYAQNKQIDWSKYNWLAQ